MEVAEFKQIANAFGLDSNQWYFEQFGGGHINTTFCLSQKGELIPKFILQKINIQVFPLPEKIANNWKLAYETIQNNRSAYQMIMFIQTVKGRNYFYSDNGDCWRLIPFVSNTYTCESVEKPVQAYQTAFAFGNFARMLDGLNLKDFSDPIPNFHNLDFREKEFELSLASASTTRLQVAHNLLLNKKSFSFITAELASLIHNNILPPRLMHHDAKIANILYSVKTQLPHCIVDFDTLMPGTIISDIGDMLRTMTTQTAEDEPDVTKISFREDFVAAILNGYLEATGNMLTAVERRSLYFGGLALVYMQAIRFLTDFLNNDSYYHIHYPEHNFVRARAQFNLLNLMVEKRQKIETTYLG